MHQRPVTQTGIVILGQPPPPQTLFISPPRRQKAAAMYDIACITEGKKLGLKLPDLVTSLTVLHPSPSSPTETNNSEKKLSKKNLFIKHAALLNRLHHEESCNGCNAN